MIQFYAPDLLTAGILPPDESRHCSKVLRHRADDVIYVIDGSGVRYQCRILDPDSRATKLEIISTEKIPDLWQPEITLAVAPTKNIDRIEWLVEKAVEIGVNRIVPLLCEHSERKVIKEERLINIAVSAMKQSLKTRLPELTGIIPFKSFLENIPNRPESSANLQKFMGYCDAAYPRKELIKEYQPGKDVVLLIGPEGDFSPAEITSAVESGFTPVSFGPSRMRTETAALFALEAIHIINMLKE